MSLPAGRGCSAGCAVVAVAPRLDVHVRFLSLLFKLVIYFMSSRLTASLLLPDARIQANLAQCTALSASNTLRRPAPQPALSPLPRAPRPRVAAPRVPDAAARAPPCAAQRMGACCSSGATDAAPHVAAANAVVDERNIKTLAAETHCACHHRVRVAALF